MSTFSPLPDLPYREFTLTPVRTKSSAQMLDRATETADYGTPYWSLKNVTTAYLKDAQMAAAELFFMRASVGGASFACHDIYYPRPAFYGLLPLSGVKAIGGAFNGTATLQSITNSRTIVVSGLPANFVFKARDMIEVRKTANTKSRSLHVIQADVIGSAGGVATLSIEYPLNPEFTAANSFVNLEKPSCAMMLQSGFNLDRWRNSRIASFSATEVFF